MWTLIGNQMVSFLTLSTSSSGQNYGDVTSQFFLLKECKSDCMLELFIVKDGCVNGILTEWNWNSLVELFRDKHIRSYLDRGRGAVILYSCLLIQFLIL